MTINSVIEEITLLMPYNIVVSPPDENCHKIYYKKIIGLCHTIDKLTILDKLINLDIEKLYGMINEQNFNFNDLSYNITHINGWMMGMPDLLNNFICDELNYLKNEQNILHLIKNTIVKAEQWNNDFYINKWNEWIKKWNLTKSECLKLTSPLKLNITVSENENDNIIAEPINISYESVEPYDYSGKSLDELLKLDIKYIAPEKYSEIMKETNIAVKNRKLKRLIDNKQHLAELLYYKYQV